MTERLPPHPLSQIYGKPALELALHLLDSVPVEQRQLLLAWIRSAAENLSASELREPTIRVPLFESHVVSLLNLAVAAGDLRRYANDWTPPELEEVAALLVSASLIRRASAQTGTPAATTEAGERAAARRGWQTVEQAITDLKQLEDQLVELGEAALSGRPADLQTWRADEDDGTFADAAGDVRRRLDFVAHNPGLFAGTALDAALRAKAEELHADAWAFFRGREGRGVPKTQLTLARDQAFTLLIPRVERLRLILRAAYPDNAEARAKVDGVFWRRLERLAKPRRKRATEEPAPTVPGGGRGPE
ncbi:MAG: hypothetical protein HY906_15790 [Deltaproteobacteria bacterium]|nr:hypothetical protein [Deltaproteobacteria bacterium]